MPFCTNCGNQIKEGSKFCGVCGTKVEASSSTEERNNSRRQEYYDGVLYKCPNCGALINSFVKNCPECGYEIRGASSSNSVHDFSEKYKQATTNSQKADLIRSFPIPNTKEDILEFIILASSNIDTTVYTRDNIVISGETTQQEITEAWWAKFEQAYQKAIILFDQDSPELKRINDLYERKKIQLNSSRDLERKKSFWESHKQWFAIGACVLSFFIMAGICLFMSGSEDRKLNRQMKKIESYISEGNYDAALAEAYAIESFNSQVRINYIERIKALQGNPVNHDGQVQIPIQNFYGDPYSDAVAAFKAAGFTNIKTEPVEYEPLIGWLDKAISKDGDVDEISVNGDSSYTRGDWVSPDSPVIIRYHQK